MTTTVPDFFDELAAVDCAGRFESFNAKETRCLRVYDQLAHGAGQSPFFDQTVRFSFKTSRAERYERLEHAGTDQLTLMALAFRQMWLKKERTEFNRVRELLLGHGKPGETRLVELLEELGERYDNARDEVLMKVVRPEDPMGPPVEEVKAAKVINDWFYSGPVHTQDAKVARAEAWRRDSYDFSFIKAITNVLFVMWELHVLVQGVLAQPELLSE
jgi:hypothetical protein